MWLFLALCIGTATASFIQLRDKNFDEDDKELARVLKKRMTADFTLPEDPDAKKYLEESVEYTFQVLQMNGLNKEDIELGDDKPLSSGQSRRQVRKFTMDKIQGSNTRRNIQYRNARRNLQTGTKESLLPITRGKLPQSGAVRRQYLWEFPNEPSIRDIKERVMEAMQQQIYAAQYRMRDLQKIIDKYSGDIRYRIGYIYCRLETLLYEMQVICTFTKRHDQKRNVNIHIIYHTYLVKKNVDVTYIVEHMIEIHTNYMERSKVTTPAISAQGANATTPDGTTAETTTDSNLPPQQQ